MKQKHDCFEKNVPERKGSKTGYGVTPWNRVGKRIWGQDLLSSLKITFFWYDGGSPFGGPKLRILRSNNHPSTGIRHPDLGPSSTY